MGRLPIDLTGQKFGELTVIKFVGHCGKGHACKWLCKCDCGGEKIVSTTLLKRNIITNCGCKTKNKLVGKRFGRLIVIENSGKQKELKGNDVIWKCKCDCGNTTYASTGNLKSGRVVSCGCYSREVHTKHGLNGTRINRIYLAAKRRCLSPSSDAYKHYGGRGIKMCDEWLGENGFINFYNWAMANGYKDDLTIERIDVNGDYCPENCRWVTMAEQMSNTTRSKRITIDGETHTVAQWCRIKGLKPGAYYGRISRGYTERDAIMTPPSPKTVKYSEDS